MARVPSRRRIEVEGDEANHKNKTTTNNKEKQVKATSTIGKAGQGYRWHATLEGLTPEQTEKLAIDGVIYNMQRCTEVDKILGILIQNGDKWERTGKKRGDVEYKEEDAKRLATALGKMLGDIPVTVSVGEYEGESTGPAYKAKVKAIEALIKDGVISKKDGETMIQKVLEQAGI